MELRHLRYFEAVAATSNVTRAAAALRVSQPSLSQAIKELEQELGTPLLVRRPHGSVLTDAGREFVRHASDILQRLPEAKAAARRAAQGAVGQLILGVTGSSVFDVVPVIMQRVREKLPDVSIRLVEMLTDRQIEALHARRIDVAIGRPLAGHPGLNSWVIAQRSFLAAMHVQHRLARRHEISLVDLRDEPLITPQQRHGPGFHAQLLAMLSKAKLNLQIAHETTHMPTVLGLVAAGLGVGIVSDELRHLEVRDVVCRPLVEGRAACQLALSWRQDNDSQTLGRFVALATQSDPTAGADAGVSFT